MLTSKIIAPQFLNLNLVATAERPALKIRVVHDERKGVYYNSSLTVEHHSIAITTTLLSKMRLGSLRKDALRIALGEKNGELAMHPPVKSFFKGSAGRAVAEKVRLEPTAEHLENAALVYQLARLVGDFPVQAVARCFRLEPADAKRWVILARRHGALS